MAWKKRSHFPRNKWYSFVPFVHVLDHYLDGAMSSTLFVEGTSLKMAMLFDFPSFYSGQAVSAVVSLFLSESPLPGAGTVVCHPSMGKVLGGTAQLYGGARGKLISPVLVELCFAVGRRC